MRIHWHGILAALTGVAGVVASPAVLGVLPPKYAAVISGLAVIYAAVTKPAVQSSAPVASSPDAQQ